MAEEGTTPEPRMPGGNLAASIGLTAYVLNGECRGESRLVGTHMTVGKAEDNHLVLSDRTVSRHHCELHRTARGIVVRDLGSTNGTRIDGTAVTEGIVPPGGVLRVGQVEIAFRSVAQPMGVLPSEQTSFGESVGQSTAMRSIFGLLEFMSTSDATVLIEGETGVGKDVLARSIARESRRRRGQLVVVDCGAISPSLVEAELFGHEKGAFTGAVAARKGAFELAQGGTVLVDAVCDLPLEVQPKLLRVLEAREIKRIGANRPTKIDVRVIATSRRDLASEVAEGKFREDLYFRLAVVPVRIPPLRSRREDIPLLVRALLGALGAGNLRVSVEAMNSLIMRRWQGNVRELRNTLERAVLLAQGVSAPELEVAHLPHSGVVEGTYTFSEARTLDQTLDDVRRAYARWRLSRAGAEDAARTAGVPAQELEALAAWDDEGTWPGKKIAR